MRCTCRIDFRCGKKIIWTARSSAGPCRWISPHALVAARASRRAKRKIIFQSWARTKSSVAAKCSGFESIDISAGPTPPSPMDSPFNLWRACTVKMRHASKCVPLPQPCMTPTASTAWCTTAALARAIAATIAHTKFVVSTSLIINGANPCASKVVRLP